MKIFLHSSSYRSGFALVATAVCATLTSSHLAQATAFTNTGSIANTRHNMTQSTAGVGISNTMDLARNDYGEVCVYCHTPHGSSAAIVAPLWNRTTKATSYTLYSSNTLTQTVAQPGGSSLACLSCHDGQTAIDSIINMPGSGGYNANQATTQNTAFLNTWNNPVGRVDTIGHQGLNSRNNIQGDGMGSQGCLVCHSDTGALGGATDFTVFLIGTDLRNDHPVGVTFPTTNGPGTGFNTPAATAGTARFFDVNGNSRMDKGEVRVYGPGAGGAAAAASATVECASCHDPHGVPSAGVGSTFNKTFLRMSNSGSALCLTCHIK